MVDSIIQATAKNLGMDTSDVAAVANELMLQLHRAQFERNEVEGADYMGASQIGTLFRALPRKAFFHFLGFYEHMQLGQTEWEQGYASEYLARLAPRNEWQPYTHQMSGWKKGNYWVGRK
ncbi:MAG: hypothetical protein JSR69_21740 [Proteobacteria bacterium]|nr:hypothetical protein [Pseudomonadota bacterium]